MIKHIGGNGWDRMLLAVIGLVTIYSIGLVAFGLTLGDAVFDRMGFGPNDGDITSTQSRDYLRLVYGILGSVIVGWMLTMAAIAAGPLQRREPWAWWAVTSAVAVWFVLDTALSLLLGFIGHALFNVAFVTALAVPLLAIRAELE